MKKKWKKWFLYNEKLQKHLRMYGIMTLFVFMLLPGLAITNAQENIDIKVKNVKLTKVFDEIESLSNYNFLYSSQDLTNDKKVSLDLKKTSIEKILQKTLKGTDLTFIIHGDLIYIKKKKTDASQDTKIKGIVKDSDGSPLPGVSVILKGTTVGVSTDIDGRFVISVPEKNDAIIVFSFVGMQTKEIKYKNQKELIVVLEEEAANLNEVVVTGYQTIKEERMTGTIETMTSKDLINTPFTSVDNLLAGKMAGVASFMSSGQAGSNSDIRIRGINTLSGTTQPLWIVDGLPLQGEIPDISGGGAMLEANILNNGIGNIAPSDIKSISVIKDAAAAAIYGARAANGVIVITTKRGHEGSMYVNYNSSFSTSMAPEIDLGFMNAKEKVQFEKDLYNDFAHDSRFSWKRGGTAVRILHDIDNGKYSVVEGNKLLDELANTPKTDWMDLLFRNSTTQTHSLNLSGGSKTTTFYFSVNYNKQDGILKSDSYENFNSRLSGSYKPNSKFDITVGMSTSIRKKKYHNSSKDPFKYAVYANPYEKAFNEDGSYAYDQTYLTIDKKKGLDENIIPGFNIINELENTHNNSKYVSTSLNGELNYYIVKGLRLSSKFVATHSFRDNSKYSLSGTYSAYRNNWIKSLLSRDVKPEEMQGYYSEETVFANEFSFNNTLEYSNEFGNWYVNALVGQEISATNTNNLKAYMPEYYPEYDIVGFPNIADVDASNIRLSDFAGKGLAEKRHSSFYSAFTVGYKDKYIANFNARMDGADIIGNQNQFTPLWSTSARWNVHKEGFIKDIPFINELAIKAEYGYTGNINREAYPFTTITLSGTNRYEGNLIASSYTHPNPSIKWEKKEERGVSLSTSLLKYRLNFNLAYYDNKVSDVLGNRKLPASAGTTSQIANVSDLQNKGYELTLNFVPIKTKEFKLGLNGNIAHNKNTISNAFFGSLNDVTIEQILNTMPQVSGYAVGSVFGVINKGVDPARGFTTVTVNRLSGEAFSEAGGNKKYIIEDIKRGSISKSKDKPLYLGETNPKYTGGFGFNMTYKNWDLNSNFIFEGGHILPKFSERLSSPSGSTPTIFSRLNVMKKQTYRWRQPGDVTDVEKYEMYLVDRIPMDTDYEKGDYLKMRSLILSYRLPISLINKMNIGIKRCRFSIQAENLFTLTKYDGIDPELRRDFGYPIPRSYRFTFNVGF